MKLEYCIICDQETGNAGIHDGSLYLDNGEGPFCQDCFMEYRVLELEDKNTELLEEIKRLLDRENKEINYGL